MIPLYWLLVSMLVRIDVLLVVVVDPHPVSVSVFDVFSMSFLFVRAKGRLVVEQRRKKKVALPPCGIELVTCWDQYRVLTSIDKSRFC